MDDKEFMKMYLNDIEQANNKQLEQDIKYMNIARVVAESSKALNKHVGAILVKENTVISMGYNGAPRGINPNDLNYLSLSATKGIIPRDLFPFGRDNFEYDEEGWIKITKDPRELLGYKSGEGLKYQIDVHAELNCIINVARMGGASTLRSTLYCYCPIPCKNCCIAIINAGISTVVCLESDLGKDRIEEPNEYNFYMSRYLFEEAGIEVVEIPIDVFKPIEKQLV